MNGGEIFYLINIDVLVADLFGNQSKVMYHLKDTVLNFYFPIHKYTNSR